MNWKELIKKLADTDPDGAKLLQAHLETLENKNTDAAKLQQEISTLTTRLEEREKIKTSANDEAAEYRHKLKAQNKILEGLKKDGILDADGAVAIDKDTLSASKKLNEEVETLRGKVGEFQKKEKTTQLNSFVANYIKEKQLTSGLKILSEAVGRQPDEFKLEQEAVTALLDGVVKEYGAPIFKVAIPKEEGDGKSGDGEGATSEGEDGKQKQTGQTAPNNPGYNVSDGANGETKISISSRRPGFTPETAPTASEFIKSVREENGSSIPANLNALAKNADNERSHRIGKSSPEGGDPVADITDAINA